MDLTPMTLKGFWRSFALTASEKKVLGFLSALLLLGAATMAWEGVTGGSLSAWAFRPISSRVPFALPSSVSKGRPGFFEAARILNVNRAAAKDLRWVPGVGPETARRIVQYRETHGGFQTLGDLQKVSGVGPKKFKKMAPHLTLALETNPSEGAP
jgi:competence ComEA-like helix-hairpin-helix protein